MQVFMEKTYTYSIIIPHYKSTKLLCRCINSIPLRRDIQIIVVDDRSGLGKEELISECPNLQNVELVILPENGGAGHARNVGLEYADGQWLLFADADDFYLDHAFSISDEYKDSDFDIIYFGVRSIDSDTGEPTERYKTYNSYVEACDNIAMDTIDKLRFRHDVPWAKMIKRDMVLKNEIRFDETKYCNDTMFSTKCALEANKIYADIRPFYCVTTCSGSLTTHTSLNAYQIRYEVILRKNQLLRKNGYSKYQHSVIFYLLKFLNFGILSFFQGIKTGLKYHANFFVGSSQWVQKVLDRVKCM